MRIRVLLFLTVVCGAIGIWAMHLEATGAVAVAAVLSLTFLIGYAIKAEEWLNRRQAVQAESLRYRLEADRIEQSMRNAGAKQLAV